MVEDADQALKSAPQTLGRQERVLSYVFLLWVVMLGIALSSAVGRQASSKAATRLGSDAELSQ